MNTEENKITEASEIESVPTESEGKKGLSKGVVVGIIAGAAVLVAVLVVVLVLTLGNKCKEHVDLDDDFLCDNCGDNFNDGLEVVSEKVRFTVTVDGAVASAIGFKLYNDEAEYSVVTDANGKAEIQIPVGGYNIEYDYDTIAESISSDTYFVTVEKGMGEIVIVLSDNTPDGSPEKPFYISDILTEITVEPGAELYFNYRGATVKYLTINSDKLAVIYDGVEYIADDGVINLVIMPTEIGSNSIFVVKNISDEQVNETLTLIAPIGSMENPYDLNEDEECHVVPAEGTIYYKWVAYEDMTLAIFVPDHKKNAISITRIVYKTVEGSDELVPVPISVFSAGEQFVYMPVSKDDEITIAVSTENKEDTLVEFEGYFFNGNEYNPVIVLMKEIDISFSEGQSIIFSTKVGNTVTISDEENVSVVYNGNTYTPNSKGKINFTIEEGCEMFTVINTADSINSVVIEVDGTLDPKPEYGVGGGGPSGVESVG